LTPQSSKAKGRRLQQLVRDLILKTFPSLGKDDVRSTSMGAGGEDVQLSTAARKFVPYQIECKNKARSQVHTWYEQATEHGDHEPLLIVKQDHNIVLAVVSLDHFMELIKNNNK
jgi:hypothetical protein